MITSLDGRLHPERWSDPQDERIDALVETHYEATAGRLQAEGWIVGRRTMAEFVDGETVPERLDAPQARPHHLGERSDRHLCVVIDPAGRLRFDADHIEGDHVVVILSERVTDAALERLRAAGVSYCFAGPDGDRLGPALEMLGEAFGVTHLLLEGGGVTNGAFLAAGLIDAFSTLICPALDGLAGEPAIVEHAGSAGSRPAAGQHLYLRACQTLEGGVIWLRHDVERDASPS
ncbi:5-amino-6-(5-phosphoribosylamino)uracil reductase [Halomonas organivorans]|uniref:5-amino-6-(5-phosphoribosylamino)uracil reductase n=2 Tax=Halomonas organivorans TaxID=257772 RepID=A0A7W5BVP3_9GAMM|nr:5-amino-6-(5-phosphoribosylamino)uracil reductase [Halomonas organivorans]